MVRGFLLSRSCYNALMRNLLKNPRAWIIIALCFFSLVALGALFSKSDPAMGEQENAEEESSRDKEPKLSREERDWLVKKLESRGDVPEDPEESDASPLPSQGNDAGAEPVASETESENQPGGVPQSSGEKTPPHGEEERPDDRSGSKGEASGEEFPSVDRLASWGFERASDRDIDTVILHSTYNPLGGDPFSVSKVIGIYKRYGVSPHYLVARDGTVFRMVDEKNIAYHAGDSVMPDGRKNVNGFSIGIEVIGKDDGSPSKEQYAALGKLVENIKGRHAIRYILGHSDIAPGRKSDPWGFDWKKIGGKEQ